MNEYLFWHQQKYPLMTQDDIIKLIYQSEFAGGHYFLRKQDVITYLNAEIRALNRFYQDLYVDISQQYVRVNLGPYLKFKLPLKYLALSFYQTAKDNKGTKEHFKVMLGEAGIASDVVENLHHSEVYRTAYEPHYRIIDRKYITEEIKYLQLKHFIENVPKGSIVAIEGKCGSGKTTMVDRLERELVFTRIPMDDFFLPPKMKTTERMAQIGGNIQYERVLELLEHIKGTNEKSFIYQRYDCGIDRFMKEEKQRQDVIILEGVYSFHPVFRHLIDRLAFIDIDDQTQNLRLQRRSNYLMYVNTWVVLENIYYDHEKIKFLSNVII